jgi:hypothetical protein
VAGSLASRSGRGGTAPQRVVEQAERLDGVTAALAEWAETDASRGSGGRRS